MRVAYDALRLAADPVADARLRAEASRLYERFVDVIRSSTEHSGAQVQKRSVVLPGSSLAPPPDPYQRSLLHDLTIHLDPARPSNPGELVNIGGGSYTIFQMYLHCLPHDKGFYTEPPHYYYPVPIESIAEDIIAAVPRRVFIHEMMHYLDYKRYSSRHRELSELADDRRMDRIRKKRRQDPTWTPPPEPVETVEEYLSKPTELYAWYQELADRLDQETIRSEWIEPNIFIEDAEAMAMGDETLPWRLDSMPEPARRKVRSRLYQYWADRIEPRLSRTASVRDRDAAAKSLDDLVALDGWVEIEVEDEWVFFRLRDPTHELVGLIEIEPAADGLWVVGESFAESGWGPLLYDIAIEYATMRGVGLASDRGEVSPDAYAVWEYYRKNRPDTETHPIRSGDPGFEPGGVYAGDEEDYELDYYVSKRPDVLVRLGRLGLIRPYVSAYEDKEVHVARVAAWREPKKVTREVLKTLRPDDWLIVYHGTDNPNFVFGLDAVDHHTESLHDEPDYAGIFVTGEFSVAQGFGDYVYEIAVQARNLHGTTWSATTGRDLRKKGHSFNRAKRRFPDSFRPYLSYTLSAGSEPQALYKGYIGPHQILAVWTPETDWLDPDDFFEAHEGKMEPRYRALPEHDLRSTRLSLREYLDTIRNLVPDLERDQLEEMLKRDGPEALAERLVATLPFSRPAATRFVQLLDGVMYRSPYSRVALTPEQKSLKKDWSVSEQRRLDPGIPPWESLVEGIGEGGERDEWVLDVKDDEIETMAYEALADELEGAWSQDLVDTIRDNEELPDTDDIVSAHSELNHIEAADILAKWESRLEALTERAGVEMIQSRYKSRYDDLVRGLDGWLDGNAVWRLVRLPARIDPTRHDGLGIYWTLEEDRAGLYNYDEDKSGAFRLWLYEAEIDLDSVNKAETVKAQMDTEYGEEREIQFYRGAPIYVNRVTEIIGYERDWGPNLEASGDFGETYMIQETRRA